jgi:hypothetical protein
VNPDGVKRRVASESAPVYATRAPSASPILTLRRGDVVELGDSLHDFVSVTTADGTRGYIRDDTKIGPPLSFECLVPDKAVGAVEGLLAERLFRGGLRAGRVGLRGEDLVLWVSFSPTGMGDVREDPFGMGGDPQEAATLVAKQIARVWAAPVSLGQQVQAGLRRAAVFAAAAVLVGVGAEVGTSFDILAGRAEFLLGLTAVGLAMGALYSLLIPFFTERNLTRLSFVQDERTALGVFVTSDQMGAAREGVLKELGLEPSAPAAGHRL